MMQLVLIVLTKRKEMDRYCESVANVLSTNVSTVLTELVYV
jgi:hypothetical protein